jgi:phosphoserine aminotransferase
VIVREDLIGHALPITPTVFDLKLQADNDSMLNTPPTYAIYIAGLVFKWLKAQGGLPAMAKHNEAKAALLYDYLDATSFYSSPIARPDRSLMNVPFKLKDESLDEAFLKGAQQRGMAAAEGPPLGRRHACVDLQRDAGGRRESPGGVHEGIRKSHG